MSTGFNLDNGYWMVRARDIRGLSVHVAGGGRFRIVARLLDKHFKEVSQPAYFFIVAINEAARVQDGE